MDSILTKINHIIYIHEMLDISKGILQTETELKAIPVPKNRKDIIKI